MLGIVLDITERKLAEEAMLDAKAQAELYLDLMSHDITNMNQALMGCLEMMEVTREAGEIDKGLIDNSIEIIKRSSRMIDEVKKLTIVQAGKVPQKAVDVCDMLSAVKARYSNVQGRAVTINYTPGPDCIVKADDMLMDVLDSLTENAVRHSTGPVTIDLAVEKVTREGRGWYEITVADTGPGIPDDLKKKIFMSLKELREKAVRRGFGLYLVRTLVDHYQGRVWVEDRVSDDYTKGSKFVVQLPASKIEEQLT
jgi:signal transduction histidine kinase